MPKLSIILPYRPLTIGNRCNPLTPIIQNPDGKWQPEHYHLYWNEPQFENDELHRAIYFINKNSICKHNIIVALDSDIFPNDTWLKEYDNVRWVKSTWEVPQEMWSKPDKAEIPLMRIAAANEAGVNAVADEDWIVLPFIEDAIAAKGWDLPIIDAINKYDEEYVYVPNFVECHGGIHQLGGTLTHGQETPDLIWNVWRRTQSCHSLVMPLREGREWINEDDLDSYIKVANSGRPEYSVERCGDRFKGYYANMVMKAKTAKKVGFKKHAGFDLMFDTDLGYKFGHNKLCITDSYILHPFGEFRWNKK